MFSLSQKREIAARVQEILGLVEVRAARWLGRALALAGVLALALLLRAAWG